MGVNREFRFDRSRVREFLLGPVTHRENGPGVPDLGRARLGALLCVATGVKAGVISYDEFSHEFANAGITLPIAGTRPSAYVGIPAIAFVLAATGNPTALKSAQRLFTTSGDLEIEARLAELEAPSSSLATFRSYDLISGAAGLILVRESLFATPQSELRRRYALALLRRSKAEAKNGESGLTVRSAPHVEFPRGVDGSHLNLGQAHGIVGILNFILSVDDASRDDTLVQELVGVLTRKLLSFVTESHQGSWTAPRYELLHSGRIGLPIPSMNMGWCYGKLSLVNALASAGLVMEDEYCIGRARTLLAELLSELTDRDPLGSLCLCHGLAAKWYLLENVSCKLGSSCDDRVLHERDKVRSELLFEAENTLARAAELGESLTEGFLDGDSGMLLASALAMHPSLFENAEWRTLMCTPVSNKLRSE